MRQLLLVPALFAGIAACGTTGADETPPANFGEQVARGQALFGEHCAECHGASGQGDEGPRLVGFREGALPLDPPSSRKVRKTRFVSVGHVAEFVVANMPPEKGGSLTNEQYLAILAFALKANNIDLGSSAPPLTMSRARELVIPR